ncbi:hypothetical protein BOTBODRAFT_39082 [Botryobasidium botryosum FD-172 SS1]|uniref:F-box domain-containing protein n=1 Tax=Botryobasidium botryosum (strain FD-172 SS1) TaxID=930990 RepID=A0A067LXM5_BOTB1|nr:hypothetical protein BOTBODRAFT_39082 [Botryobasidium botryosum FD-172 SS1]
MTSTRRTKDFSAPRPATQASSSRKARRAIVSKDSDGDDEREETRPAKRARAGPKASNGSGKGKAKLRGNIGKLAGLLEMPLDIFLEVSTHLQPVDLLHLARTSKTMRQLLMSKTSKFAWKSARQNVPYLPECPEDLSEPQYTSLLFDRDCHVCGTPRIQRVDFTFRARLCETCHKRNVVVGHSVDCDIKVLSLVPHVSPLPSFPFYMPDLQELGFREPDPSLCYYYKPEIAQWAARFKDVQKKQRGERKSDVPQRVDLWVADRKEAVARIMAHAGDLEHWKDQTRKDKVASEAAIVTERVEAIKDKLYAEGWTPADIPQREAWTKLVSQPRPLTPRIWKTLYPKLVPLLEEAKEFRLRAEHRARVQTRKGEVELHFRKSFVEDPDIKDTMPGAEDICHFPSLAPLLELEAPVSDEAWDKVKETVKRDAMAHIRKIRRDLVRLLREVGVRPADSEAAKEAASVPAVDEGASPDDDKGKGKGKAKEVQTPDEPAPHPMAGPSNNATSGSQSSATIQALQAFIEAFASTDSEISETDVSDMWDDWDDEYDYDDWYDQEFWHDHYDYGYNPLSISDLCLDKNALSVDEKEDDADDNEETDRANVEILDRAHSVFSCATCKDPLRYPKLLEHSHILTVSQAFWGGKPRRWTIKSLQVQPDAHAVACALLQSLGADKNAPLRDMATQKYECLCCRDTNRSLSWSGLVDHFYAENLVFKKLHSRLGLGKQDNLHAYGTPGAKLASSKPMTAAEQSLFEEELDVSEHSDDSEFDELDPYAFF